MLFWLLTIFIIFLIVVIFLFIKNSIDNDSYKESEFSNKPTVKSSPLKKEKKLKAIDILPSVKKLKDKKEFNWEKLHKTLNPTKNLNIQNKITELIRNEREYIIIDKFIYWTNQHPNFGIMEILNEVEKNTLEYQKILRKLGNK